MGVGVIAPQEVGSRSTASRRVARVEAALASVGRPGLDRGTCHIVVNLSRADPDTVKRAVAVGELPRPSLPAGVQPNVPASSERRTERRSEATTGTQESTGVVGRGSLTQLDAKVIDVVGRESAMAAKCAVRAHAFAASELK